LDGNDGIFDMTYYDFLPAFDLTVFPSYYEPWGYTPLESLAFRVPSITTSLSGFGIFVRENVPNHEDAIAVIDRSDDNRAEVVDTIVNRIISFQTIAPENILRNRKKALDIAMMAGWDEFIQYYFKAFSIALHSVETRRHLFRSKQQADVRKAPVPFSHKHIEWKKILIKPSIPKSLEALDLLARNLWWTWNIDAIALFESIDPAKWSELQQNPLALIESLTFKRIQGLSADMKFQETLDVVYKRFTSYMKAAENKPNTMIAYFSMEFGIHDILKIYSGGLGVLAGDYLKEASDTNQHMIGIGLLYRYGYFQQNLSLIGDQIANMMPQKFTQMPILPVRDNNGNWVTISLALPGRNMYAKVWRADVGRIPLYLLDTDIPENLDYDKGVTHQLYGGDWENRFKQEFLLGVGGKRMLDALRLRPDIYHLNEGHAAFTGLERLRHYMQSEKLNFRQAIELVRATSLFTSHTPVPAGHDSFSEDLLRTYIPHYAERLSISWEDFMDLGRWSSGNKDEKFSMSVLAAKLSQEMNGVSRIHGRVTREMFASLYPGYFPEEINIGHVTNGVHYPTWAAAPWQELYEKTFGEGFLGDQSNADYWQKIYDVPDQIIWEIRNRLRADLINYLKMRVLADLKRRQENPKTIARILDSMRSDILTIGFARRFATYKRAHLLFNDLERLKTLVNNPEKPVQLIFAGKAHPADKAGQELIKRIMQISKEPDFLGKITFVENYDMELAAKLVQGVDVWLNTPTRPLEASGTSGEKAVINGVMNLSVLDGWYAEGYKPGAGWALPEEKTYTNQNLQDELDSLGIYNILEHEIIPTFYNHVKDGLPKVWIRYVKNTIAGIAPHYTTKRMLDDYINLYYSKMIERSVKLKADNFELIREITSWKRRLLLEWENIEVLDVKLPDSTNQPLNVGDIF
ncbi:MAG: alpha-glucan family phosphorylase, partial [Bacteroidales bacterium]|nr:alpha-glucan family phosphorylase [Bacteroidales bacterium]